MDGHQGWWVVAIGASASHLSLEYIFVPRTPLPKSHPAPCPIIGRSFSGVRIGAWLDATKWGTNLVIGIKNIAQRGVVADLAGGVGGCLQNRRSGAGEGLGLMEIIASGGTLHLVGDFDVRSTGAVRDAIYDRFEKRGDVVIDLSEVGAVDLTALRVLAVATRHASQRGDHLRLRGCSPSVRRMLHLSRLAAVVEVERVAAIA